LTLGLGRVGALADALHEVAAYVVVLDEQRRVLRTSAPMRA
jgi:hypothetical protein